MKRAIAILAIALLALLLAAALSFGALREGMVKPPTGTLRMGLLTIMALPPCPTQPGNPFGPGRRCGSASPYAVWAIVRLSDGRRQQWELLTMVVEPDVK